LAAAFHEFATEDAVGETGEVLDVGGGCELTAGSDVVGHPSFEEDWFEFGTGGVYGGGVGGGTTSDDAEFRFEDFNVRHGGGGDGCGGSALSSDQVTRFVEENTPVVISAKSKFHFPLLFFLPIKLSLFLNYFIFLKNKEKIFYLI
jgi:hypothetical protein